MIVYPNERNHRFPVSGNPEYTHLDVSMQYSKGGINYFTYEQEPRGYYLHIQPVKVERGFVTVVAFTGVKTCVKTVTRKSAKAEQAALENAESIAEAWMERICNKYNLTIKKEDV